MMNVNKCQWNGLFELISPWICSIWIWLNQCKMYVGYLDSTKFHAIKIYKNLLIYNNNNNNWTLAACKAIKNPNKTSINFNMIMSFCEIAKNASGKYCTESTFFLYLQLHSNVLAAFTFKRPNNRTQNRWLLKLCGRLDAARINSAFHIDRFVSE